jgi:hypothetical protein
VESIHIPVALHDYIELFMFGHGSDCIAEASTYNPPIGTRLRVALSPATLVSSSSNSHIRLESRVFSKIGSGEPMFGYSTAANSVFDYKNELPALAAKFAPLEMTDKRQWFDDFVYFEGSKDLLRLEKAMNEKDRMDILERLLYCPNIDYSYLLHSKIGRLTESINILGRPRLVTWNNRLVFGKEKLTRRETQLLLERKRLEQAGDLNFWKNWKNSAN